MSDTAPAMDEGPAMSDTAPAMEDRPSPEPESPAPAPAMTVAEMKPDGHVYWCEVDVFEGDTSPYNVKGMAGNASEWTGSWVTHPTRPELQVPVRRGASFVTRSAEDLKLTNRRIALDPSETSLLVGFRTASDSAPATAP